jgi:RNA-directed DNA polymerase
MRTIKATKSPVLASNDEKRGIYLKGHRRMVTGLIVTPTSQISLGRERKRLISVMLHKVLIGTLGAEQMGYFKGIIGFCLAIEPAFITRMRRKYGNEPIDRVLAFAPLPRSLSSAP